MKGSKMPPAVPAKPQGFIFKMRLVAPNGTPFGSMKYRLKWGSKLIPEPPLPPRTTGPNGEIAMLLDAAAAVPPQGVLLAIDQAGPNENIVWSIPLQLAQDPPPTGMPGIDRAPRSPRDDRAPVQQLVALFEERRYGSAWGATCEPLSPALWWTGR